MSAPPIPSSEALHPSSADEPGAATDTAIEWQVHLARRQPGRAVLLLLGTLSCSLLCFSLFRNWLFALFTAGALLAATSEFLFPIRYRLTAEAAEMRNLHNWRRITWAEVRKAYLLDDGIKLSPLAVPNRLESFRGVMLRFGPGAGEREALLTVVRGYRDAVRSDAD